MCTENILDAACEIETGARSLRPPFHARHLLLARRAADSRTMESACWWCGYNAMSRPHSRFISVPELLKGQCEESHGTMVRTIGRLLRYDVKHSLLWLGHCEPPYLELPVDSSLVEPFPFSRGALYQFIGEVDGSKKKADGAVVRALAYRCVEGLDMEVYVRAMAVRTGGTAQLNSSLQS